MDLLLTATQPKQQQPLAVTIAGSKSESNRLLILQAQYPEIQIDNLSTSDDTSYLKTALKHRSGTVDIGHAGTAMRFLTAYYATQPGVNITLTGSDRIKQRPIQPLVNALINMGAQITYLKHTGYLPLQIIGTSLQSQQPIQISASTSSQYITALLLIAPKLPHGLQLQLTGTISSRPYIDMTVQLMQSIGVTIQWQTTKDQICVQPLDQPTQTRLTVQSDWSSAGYWYSWVALQDIGYSVTLQHYDRLSLQGDSRLQEYYQAFGVITKFNDNQLIISKQSHHIAQHLHINLIHQPDLAQTLFATCLALGVSVTLTGLHTLPIKETDRIAALKSVGLRFRESVIKTTNSTIELSCKPLQQHQQPIVIDTYNDHRMAMAFAPLACKTPLIIKDAQVVTKSYPEYWSHFKKLNVDLTQI